jgi:branched-chain amino acid transport system substrate-binding protein
VCADLSGPASASGQSINNAATLARDEINGNGGINGRQIELLVEDDKGESGQFTQAIGKLISQAKVSAILAPGVGAADKAAVAQAKVPVLTLSGAQVEESQAGDYCFAIASAYSSQGADMGKYAANNLNAKRAAILLAEDSGDGLLAKSFEDNFTKLGGQITARQSYAPGTKTFKDQLKAAAATEPEVIYLPGTFQEAGVIAREAKELGIKAVLLGTDGWNNPKLFELGGSALDGSYITGPYSADDPTQANRDFTSAYKKRFGSAPDQTAALAYDAIKLLSDAFKRAGTADGAKLRDAIAQTAKFSGLTGVITIDPQGYAARPITIFKLQGGKIYPVYRSEG